MEIFTEDRRVRNELTFPENITPFPDTADALYDDRTAEILPPEFDHHSSLPRQKLRPIRCNGRNFPDFPDHSASENLDIGGTLLSRHGVASPELGFLSQLSAQKLSVANTQFLRNDVLGDHYRTSAGKMKLEANDEFANLVSEARLLGEQFSLSSDDGESSEATAESSDQKKKRKRKRRKKLELFLEDMMKKVIQKQEQMHKQLIEMIEKKERERIVREEAWKKMEIERAKRDEEARAQETSRNLALISYIQNILGHEIQIPKPVDEIQSLDHKDFKCDDDSSSSRRWPKSEVQALITVRSALDLKLPKSGPNACVWDEVAVGLSNMGYNRTAKKCKEKWENINKYYRRTIESGKKRPDYAKACPYFHELDLLYKSGLVVNQGGNASSNNLTDETEDTV